MNELRSASGDYLVFDTETTGLNPASDQIIEISIQVGSGDDSEIKTRRLKPTIAISREATAIHGITKEDLKDCPTFKQLGNSIREFFEKATVIVGYNVSFDLQILQAELQRNGFEPIQLHNKSIVDPLNIWRRLRPRKLTDAYKKFCGKDLPDAHSAEADVRATDEVFQAMRKSFGLEKASFEELTALSVPGDWVGISNQIRWKNGVPTFGFGKGRGKSVWDYLKTDPSYVDWMKGASFLPHVLDVCESAVRMEKQEFLTWAARRYPPRESVSEGDKLRYDRELFNKSQDMQESNNKCSNCNHLFWAVGAGQGARCKHPENKNASWAGENDADSSIGPMIPSRDFSCEYFDKRDAHDMGDGVVRQIHGDNL